MNGQDTVKYAYSDWKTGIAMRMAYTKGNNTSYIYIVSHPDITEPRQTGITSVNFCRESISKDLNGKKCTKASC